MSYIGANAQGMIANLETIDLPQSGSIKIAGHEHIRHDIANDKLVYGTGVPAHTIVQVISNTFTGTASSSNNIYTPSFLTESITSKATNSKFLVMVTSITGGNDATAKVQLRRTIGTNVNYIENADGNTFQDSASNTFGVTMISDARLSSVRHGTNLHLSYVDSPSVSSGTSINYKIWLRSVDSNAAYLGRSAFSDTESSAIKVLSSMIIMEIAA